MKRLLVKVKLHDILKDRKSFTEGKSAGFMARKIEENSSAEDLVSLLGFDRELVGLVVVNGRQVGFSYRLQEGDEVSLFSPMSGG